MINIKLLILVLGVVRISYASKLVAHKPEPEPEINDEEEPEDGEEPEDEGELDDEEDPDPDDEDDKELEDEEKSKEKPQTVTKTEPVEECNLYYRNYQWALQDCVCRPFQNECCMKNDNTKRVKDGNTPFVPVTEELCKSFIPKKCSVGFPVVAKFPIPAPCGCNRKPGSIATERFYSLCHLLKYSAENRKPFLSYSYYWPI